MHDGERFEQYLEQLDVQPDHGLAPDAYLMDVGTQHPSHAFLRGNTQRIYQRQVRLVAAALGARSGRMTQEARVLDWGCGKGHMSYLLRREGFQVTSCDIVTPADDSAFGQPTPIIDEQRIDVVPLRDPMALPFDDGSFDLVLSFGVLEHVHNDAASLRELRRVVQRDGLCWISFLPYTLSWSQRLAHARGDRYHDRLYSRKGVEQLAHDAGFRVLRMTHGQLFPKNSVSWRAASILEPLDRWLCRHTPLRYLATNLEVMLAPV